MGDIAAINDELQYNGIVPMGYVPDMRKIRIKKEPIKYVHSWYPGESVVDRIAVDVDNVYLIEK